MLFEIEKISCDFLYCQYYGNHCIGKGYQMDLHSNSQISISDASEKLDVSLDTIRRWEKKGLIKAHRSANGHRYFDKKEFDGDDHTHTVKSGPRRMIRLLVTDAEEVTAVDAVVSTAKLAVCKLDKALFLL
jgi:hypothetical protein